MDPSIFGTALLIGRSCLPMIFAFHWHFVGRSLQLQVGLAYQEVGPQLPPFVDSYHANLDHNTNLPPHYEQAAGVEARLAQRRAEVGEQLVQANWLW